MKDKIEQYKEERKILVENIKDYIKDKSIPFEDRYAVFELSEDILPLKSWVQRVKSFEEAFDTSYGGDFYWESSDTITWIDLFENISEEFTEYYDDNGNPTEKMITIIEDVMAAGYSGFYI